MSDLGPYEDIVAFQCLERELAAKTFAYHSPPNQENLFKTLSESELARIFNKSPPDDRTAFLEGLPHDEVERLLTLLTPEHQQVALPLLLYGEGTVRRLMTPDFIGVKESWTINQVLDHVRHVGRD